MGLLDNLQKRRDEYGASKFFGVVTPIPLWTPPGKAAGKYDIRVVPMRGNEAYYVDYWAHFQLGSNMKDAVICTRTKHDECPICDVINEIREVVRDTQDKRLEKILNGSKGKIKFLTHVVLRQDSKMSSLLIYMMGAQVEKQITGIMIGEEAKEDEDEEVEIKEGIGDVTDLKRGYWLQLKVDPKAGVQDYYKVRPYKAPSPLAKNVETIKKLLKQRCDLAALIDQATNEPKDNVGYAKTLRRIARLDRDVSSGGKKKRRREEPDDSEYEESSEDSDDIPF